MDNSIILGGMPYIFSLSFPKVKKDLNNNFSRAFELFLRRLAMAGSRGESEFTVKWSGETLADSAAECRAGLLKAFSSADRVFLDLSECTQIDIPAIQLIIASALEAANTGKKFSLVEPLPAEMKRIFELAGVSAESLKANGRQ